MNVLEKLEKLIGISRQEQLNIMEQVRENKRILSTCNLHDFSIEVPQPHNLPKYKCKNCGGIVDYNQKLWYEAGLNHGSRRNI